MRQIFERNKLSPQLEHGDQRCVLNHLIKTWRFVDGINTCQFGGEGTDNRRIKVDWWKSSGLMKIKEIWLVTDHSKTFKSEHVEEIWWTDKSLTQPALETCGGILVNGQDTHTDIESNLESSGGILVIGQDTHTPPKWKHVEETWWSDKSLTQQTLETCGVILVKGQNTHTDTEVF